MFNKTPTKSFCNLTPVRRVGLSRLNRNQSFSTPANDGNFVKKTGLNNEVLKKEENVTKIDPSSYKKRTPSKLSVLRDTNSPLKFGVGRKIGINSPMKELKNQSKVKNEIEFEDTKSDFNNTQDPQTPNNISVKENQAIEVKSEEFEPDIPDAELENTNPLNVIIEPDKINSISTHTKATSSKKQENSSESGFQSTLDSNESQISVSTPLENSSKKKVKKYHLSLTLTPDQLKALRKRKLELSGDTPSKTPKRQKLSTIIQHTTRLSSKFIDLTQSDDSSEENESILKVFEVNSTEKEDDQPKSSSNVSNISVIDDDEIKVLNSVIDQKRNELKFLKGIVASNIETKKLINQWREAGIQALDELAQTRTPQPENEEILNYFNIPTDIFDI